MQSYHHLTLVCQRQTSLRFSWYPSVCHVRLNLVPRQCQFRHVLASSTDSSISLIMDSYTPSSSTLSCENGTPSQCESSWQIEPPSQNNMTTSTPISSTDTGMRKQFMNTQIVFSEMKTLSQQFEN